MSKGIRFEDEFKQDAVAQVVERGYAVREVAERLAINTKLCKLGKRNLRNRLGLAQRWRNRLLRSGD